MRICAPKMKLNARQIETAKPKEKAYKMADGGGLYLEVSPKGSKYWRMKYRRPSDKRKIDSLLVYTRRSLWLKRGVSAMQQRNCCLRVLTPKLSKGAQAEIEGHIYLKLSQGNGTQVTLLGAKIIAVVFC